MMELRPDADSTSTSEIYIVLLPRQTGFLLQNLRP